MKKLKQKLRSRAGESISETLVAVLIAALALVMLAGAMSAASSVVTRSRVKLKEYYDRNEEMMTGGVKMVIDITDTSGTINTQSCKIEYYQNDAFGGKPVTAYKMDKSE